MSVEEAGSGQRVCEAFSRDCLMRVLGRLLLGMYGSLSDGAGEDSVSGMLR